MSRRISKAYVTVPLMYVAVIFGLIILQFSRGGVSITDAVGSLRLAGMAAAGEAPKPTELHVRFQGLDFTFGDRAAASLEPVSGAPQKLILEGFQKLEQGFELRFENNLALRFTLEGGESLAIRPVPAGPQKLEYRSLTFPFSVIEGAQANNVERLPMLSVLYRDKNYFLSLSGKSKIDMARKLLTLVPENGLALATVAEAKGTSTDSFFTWYANQGGTQNKDAFSRRTSDYLAKAWEGWRSTRFSAETGTWTNDQGGRSFNEGTVTAYLAEALRRGSYAAAFEQTSAAAQQNQDRLTYVSDPYFGNLLESTTNLEREDRREVDRVLALIRSKDLSVLARDSVAQLMTDRASEAAYNEFLRFLQQADLTNASRQVALGALWNYLHSQELTSEVAVALERFSSLINEAVFPSIIKIREGFFLQAEPGKVDVEASVRAGRILILAGRQGRDDTLESIGRDLVMSPLNLADDQGFLPRTITYQDQSLKGTEGRLSPESLYPLITENPYYPRFVSLSKTLGRGSWLYTGAVVESVTADTDKLRFTFRFPAGRTHHLTFKGARPYQELQIWGISWRIDSRFERYPIGAYFEEDRGLFFAKYNHKRDQEELLFRY